VAILSDQTTATPSSTTASAKDSQLQRVSLHHGLLGGFNHLSVVIIDIYSRYVVAWTVAAETGELAETLTSAYNANPPDSVTSHRPHPTFPRSHGSTNPTEKHSSNPNKKLSHFP